ncbi:hypothetical protein [Alkalicoccobacillus gibsonii]|uniref:hypothetical protein n=1 Tax=Alkalicoccobacillus gibsonii TaxID=79881 RepID=UPI00193442AE|nr:hypothetical protein [Alkalicoccobacillus gibsonii]MBM0065927.1 hypothetical protein [Alkalicoccobacillus gibsonii]
MGQEMVERRKDRYLFVEGWLWFGIVVMYAVYATVSALNSWDDFHANTTYTVVSYLFRGLFSIALLIKVIKMREFKKTIRFYVYLGLLVVTLVVFFFPFQMFYE